MSASDIPSLEAASPFSAQNATLEYLLGNNGFWRYPALRH